MSRVRAEYTNGQFRIEMYKGDRRWDVTYLSYEDTVDLMEQLAEGQERYVASGKGEDVRATGAGRKVGIKPSEAYW